MLDVTFPLCKLFDLGRIKVKADDFYALAHKGKAERQTDIAEADDAEEKGFVV